MFKSALFYRITCPKTQAILNDWEELTTLLERKPAYLPTGSQWRGLGFDLPVPSVSDMLVYSGPGGTSLFSLYIHERMLPGATIREHVHARCKKIEDRESRKCYAKERAQIRDEVMAELLPKAFIKHSFIQMLVIDDLLVIDTSSAKKAEDALSTLREALGSLPVRPVSYKADVVDLMTNMVDDENSYDYLRPGVKAKLVDAHGAQVSIKDLDLASEAISEHRGSGFKAHELQILLHDRDDDASLFMTFNLTDKLVFKSLKFDGLKLDLAKADADGDPAAYFDATLAIFTGAMRTLMKTLDQAIEEVAYEKKDAYTPPQDDLAELTKNALAGVSKIEIDGQTVYQSPNLDQAEQQAIVEEEEDDTFAMPAADEDEDDEL